MLANRRSAFGRHPAGCREAGGRFGDDGVSRHQRQRRRRPGHAAARRGRDPRARLCAEPRRARARLAEDQNDRADRSRCRQSRSSRPVVRGAETTARKAGYRVLLCNSEDDLRLEREYIDDLVEHRVEGLLLAPASDRSRVALLPLLRSSFPIVLLDRALPDIDCDSRRQRQHRRRAKADRASDPRWPSPHRALHRLRGRVDRPRPPARLSAGARSRRHRLLRRSHLPNDRRSDRRLSRRAAHAGARSAPDARSSPSTT